MKRDPLKFILTLPPSVNRLWRMGRGKMYRSKNYEEWRTLSLWRLSCQMRGKTQITGHYRLRLEAVRPDRRKRDLGNLEKAAHDVLVAAEIVEDDSYCQVIELAWVKAGPECVIYLESLDD